MILHRTAFSHDLSVVDALYPIIVPIPLALPFIFLGGCMARGRRLNIVLNRQILGAEPSHCAGIYLFNSLVLSGNFPVIMGFQIQDPVSLPAVIPPLATPTLPLMFGFLPVCHGPLSVTSVPDTIHPQLARPRAPPCVSNKHCVRALERSQDRMGSHRGPSLQSWASGVVKYNIILPVFKHLDGILPLFKHLSIARACLLHANALPVPEISSFLKFHPDCFDQTPRALCPFNSLVATRDMYVDMSPIVIFLSRQSMPTQGCTYLEVEQEEEHMRRVIALAHTLRQHFQPVHDGSFEARICDLLGKKELERLQKAFDMPIHAISDITRVVRRSQTIDGSTKARFDLHLDEVTSALVICERCGQPNSNTDLDFS